MDALLACWSSAGPDTKSPTCAREGQNGKVKVTSSESYELRKPVATATARVFVLTLERCWHTLCQHCSREVLARANSTPGQVLAQGVLTAG